MKNIRCTKTKKIKEENGIVYFIVNACVYNNIRTKHYSLSVNVSCAYNEVSELLGRNANIEDLTYWAKERAKSYLLQLKQEFLCDDWDNLFYNKTMQTNFFTNKSR